MRSKNKKWIAFFIVFALGAGTFIFIKNKPQASKETVREITPVIGTIQTFISSTGTIQPQNRLEIKPPINGRIDQILVREGEMVKTGQIIAWMSSTERAALLDGARAQGAEAVKRWQDVYKATPLIAPIDGQVIVSTDQPGQTVTATDVVIVLSDHLIVQAQVDETDIGKVALGQPARITLDAYSAIKVNGKVDHVYYESKVVNNVTIYQVDILPEEVPPVFRSGMSANVDIIQENKENILTIPAEAVQRGRQGSFVMVSQGPGQKPVRQKVELGISDDKNVEVISGLDPNDKVVIMSVKYSSPRGNKSGGTSPFMPARPGGGGNRR